MQRCKKLKKNIYVPKKYDYYEYYNMYNVSDRQVRVIDGIRRIYHMENLPYDQNDTFKSIKFNDVSLNLINMPSLILKHVIYHLDLKSIYLLSRTCWKLLLFTRTNVISVLVFYLFEKETDFMNKYLLNMDHFHKHMRKYGGYFNNLIEDYGLNKSVCGLKNLITFDDPYGFQISMKCFHVVEVLLFNFRYIVFKNAFEYIIKNSFNEIICSDDIYNIINEKFKDISTSFCNNKCDKYKRHVCIFYKGTKVDMYQNLFVTHCDTEDLEYYFDDNFKYDYVYDH